MAWYDTAYLYKKSITIDHTKVAGTSDLSSFPVLISVTDANLATVGNGGSVQNSSGYDLIFIDSTEATKLDHEVETYTASSGALVAWVRIPTLSHTSDTVIYCYFGNSSISTSQENKTGVWDSNYKGVFHLKDGSTLSASDSTSSSNNGTISGATATTGQIDGGANFVAASNQKITWSGIALSAPYTLSGWIYPQSGSGGYATFFANATADDGVWYGGSNHKIDFFYSGVDHYNNTTLTVNTWYLIAVTVDGSGNATFYLNGSSDGTTSSVPAGLTIASSGSDSSNESLNGKLDELRLSSGVARSSGWIGTEYNNQNSPSAFYSVGPLVHLLVFSEATTATEVLSLQPSLSVLEALTTTEALTLQPSLSTSELASIQEIAILQLSLSASGMNADTQLFTLQLPFSADDVALSSSNHNMQSSISSSNTSAIAEMLSILASLVSFGENQAVDLAVLVPTVVVLDSINSVDSVSFASSLIAPAIHIIWRTRDMTAIWRTRN